MIVIDTPIKYPGKRIKYSHLLSNTNDVNELHEFAKRIELKRGWFEYSAAGIPHYDVPEHKFELAISTGAAFITRNELYELLQKLRRT